MIRAAGNAGLISGFNSATDDLSINHHTFADDILIFCEATEDEIKNEKATLLCFDTVSRLRVNFFKSEIIGVCDLISFRG